MGTMPQSPLPLRYLDTSQESAILCTRRTHRYCKLVRLPSVEGMLPLSWLVFKYLQHARRPASASRTRAAAARAPTRHAQIRQAREAAERGGDGAAQLVVVQEPATRTQPSLSIAHPSRRGPRSHVARTANTSS